MSSSLVAKTISSFDSRRVNALVTNSEQPLPDDNMALRIQQLEQGQQRIEVLMENLLLTLQRPPNNDEVPPQDEATGGEDESRALTKKDVDDILAKAKEDDILKEHGIKPPYPLWMHSAPFPPKFKQPLLQTYTGKGSARQHVIHFKILTGTIADQDALKIRLFASTLKGTAFDWYSTLPEDSMQNWTRFLTHFKGEDHPVTMAQLCSLKQGENESTYDFIHKWKSVAYKCSYVLPQASLVNICRNNMRARIRSMIINNKSKNLGELFEASMEAETEIVKIKLTAQQRRQAKKQLRKLKQQEKAQTKREVLEKAKTSSTASLEATEESLPKASRVARKFTLGDCMPPQLKNETTQGASYSCNSVVGFSMNGYESSNTTSDTDEWEESLETGEYLSNEEWIPESHLMPVIWYNPFQPQGSWSDDDED
ncbi:hypothetical protein MRB53_034507 [Persea americana]|uniref:Uncharacterized protein n=1 Tax=Persea americana TaxID=3435 RepID=A0ACC2K225_PERAE|nr:hypothetical protein MRB53_034507 [Persea americana]